MASIVELSRSIAHLPEYAPKLPGRDGRVAGRFALDPCHGTPAVVVEDRHRNGTRSRPHRAAELLAKGAETASQATAQIYGREERPFASKIGGERNNFRRSPARIAPQARSNRWKAQPGLPDVRQRRHQPHQLHLPGMASLANTRLFQSPANSEWFSWLFRCCSVCLRSWPCSRSRRLRPLRLSYSEVAGIRGRATQSPCGTAGSRRADASPRNG